MEWPLAVETADHRVEPARTAGRERLPVVRRDLFLDDRARLTEQERALMSAMLVALVDQIADEVRLGLPADLVARAEPERERIAPALWRSGALDRPALVLLLLRRADEQLIEAACRGARASSEGGTVERLVGDGDGAVAGAAMALAVARGRRRDRFGRIGIEFDDIPRGEAEMLVHLVAAQIRRAMAGDSVAVDEAVAGAALRLLERHDERRRVDARVLALGEALIEARGEDDGLLAALAAEGDAALLAALCALRANISQDSGWMLLVDDGARDAMLLARLAGLGRPTAAAMVAALAEPLLWGEPGAAIAAFDALGAAEVDAARRWWRLPAAYRDALDRGGANGRALD